MHDFYNTTLNNSFFYNTLESGISTTREEGLKSFENKGKLQLEGKNLLDLELESYNKMKGRLFMYYDNIMDLDKGNPEQVMEVYAENYDNKELIRKNYKGVRN